jgi:hypothetical protein
MLPTYGNTVSQCQRNAFGTYAWSHFADGHIHGDDTLYELQHEARAAVAFARQHARTIDARVLVVEYKRPLSHGRAENIVEKYAE